jgi:outer membrane PBP1 activator LpoA protein
MAQRLSAFLLLCCLVFSGTVSAEPAAPNAPMQKSPEERFLEGIACLQQADLICSRVALASINPASPYAKILDAGIAAANQNYDQTLRLLLPLEVEKSLLPAAQASLHASLALAYENQGNPLRALEHRCHAESYLSTQEELAANQQQLWRMISALPHETLLEMRGESPDAIVQGWIDLAATDRSKAAGEQWRSAYPEHPAADTLLLRLAETEAAPAPNSAPSLQGKIALLLPLEIPAFSSAAKAVQGGIEAAMLATNSNAQLSIYPTAGNKESATEAYRRAVAEGASYVIGPLARDEVSALADPDLVTIPTLALNNLDQDATVAKKLMLFGLPMEEEARRLAGQVRGHGMLSATLVVAPTPLANHMAQTFAAAWGDEDGIITQSIEFSPDSNLADIRSQIAAKPADMIFLAANPEQARLVRPYLDPSVPTYGLSHLYDGDAGHPLNAKLAAIHFVDMPWLINPASPDFSAFRRAAATFPPGEMQRWFAVGVDAWNFLAATISGNGTTTILHGLSGTLTQQGNRIMREIPMAQFRSDGVFLEQAQ